ncbi:hypothetical protein H310_08704 [Aphanomyces invadans]|uniref:START domain-containing protein n=1 Tax=Aphanomyces invadans TaxID=157072 RepID=A0A024TZ05_9STRA|nr:hypothetical protein H310_08704 [Aphanomyces invadans]ETV98582.1 hypothetical protein H310_08704 [Aphanomyces invadans]|eukprot:XP_008872779.1 hypothetical protein H310_08704 [Aphanomyces invadans]
MNAVEEDALLQFLIDAGPLDVQPSPTVIQIDLDGLLDDDVALGDDDDDATENSATDDTSSVDFNESTSKPTIVIPQELKRKMQLAKASKKHRTRQKDELKLLREVVTRMESQLDMLKKVKAVEGEHGSQWEQLARAQYLERQRAYQENAKLKRALEDQLKFAQALETLVRKKPKLASSSEFENEEWKLSKLGLTKESREHSIRCIMERHYEALNGVLVRNALYDATHEIKQVKMSYQSHHSNAMSFDMARAVKMPFPYLIYAEASWRFLASVDMDNTPDSEAIEVIDSNTRYISRKVCKSGEAGCPFFGKSRATIICSPLCRRYIEPNRVVILWKSVLEDELYPRDPTHLVSNQNGWMVVEADGDNSCHVKSYVERLAPMRAGKVVALDEMMKSLHIPSSYADEMNAAEKGQAGRCGSTAVVIKDDNAVAGSTCTQTDVGVMSEYFMRSFIGMAQCNEFKTMELATKLLKAKTAPLVV